MCVEQLGMVGEDTLKEMDAVEKVYYELLIGTRKKFPKGFWAGQEGYERAATCTQFLIEVILKWNKEEVCTFLSHEGLIRKYKLTGMYNTLFKSLYDVIDNAYKGQYMPWELPSYNNEHLKTDEGRAEALKWLIEEKLKWADGKVKSHFSLRLLQAHGLSFLHKDKESLYDLINLAYPDKYKPWEFRRTSNHFWTEATSKEAFKWLIEERLNWTREEVVQSLTNQVIQHYGLAYPLDKFYHCSIYAMLEDLFPGKYQPWEMKKLPLSYWDSKEHCYKAVAWLLKVRLKETIIPEGLKLTHFRKNQLGGLMIKYDNCPRTLMRSLSEFLD